MLATLQKSMLDWLQLKPELLSGTPARALAGAKPANLPASPEHAPAAPDMHTGLINAATVQASPAGMTFYRPAAPAQDATAEPWQQILGQAYPAPGVVYNPVESGGNQKAALAEMTGYLETRLRPNPPKRQRR